MFILAAFNLDHEFRHTSTLFLLESYDISSLRNEYVI